MQYYGQLNDIEIVSPHQEMEEGEQVDELIAAFEEAYAKVYARSARSPELGYLITQAIVHGSVEVEKPALPELDESSGEPPVSLDPHRPLARRRRRDRRSSELEEVGAGHEIAGPGDRRALGNDVRDPARPQRAARPPPDLPPRRRWRAMTRDSRSLRRARPQCRRPRSARTGESSSPTTSSATRMGGRCS